MQTQGEVRQWKGGQRLDQDVRRYRLILGEVRIELIPDELAMVDKKKKDQIELILYE